MVPIKRIHFLALLSGLSLFLSSCQMTYLIKNAYHQSAILMKRESVEKTLKRSDISEETKRKIRLAQEVKVFAEEALGLVRTKNYSSYVDLQRPYVSWIVQAAPEYSLKAYKWSFPFVGEVPYKGFFSEEEALKAASEFSEEDYDTYVRGVTAYSTLGWFRDPLLNTMMDYSDSELVELIIHESVHATVYLKGEAEFNERLATFVGQLGAEMYFRKLEGDDSPTLKAVAQDRKEQKIFSDFLSEELRNLEKWYDENKNQVTNEAKVQRLKEIQHRFEKEIKTQLNPENFKNFATRPLNNAYLVGLSTYQMDLKDFEEAYKKLGSDPKTFIQFVIQLKGKQDPQAELKGLLSSAD